jgi:hypothetical protein
VRRVSSSEIGRAASSHACTDCCCRAVAKGGKTGGCRREESTAYALLYAVLRMMCTPLSVSTMSDSSPTWRAKVASERNRREQGRGGGDDNKAQGVRRSWGGRDTFSLLLPSPACACLCVCCYPRTASAWLRVRIGPGRRRSVRCRNLNRRREGAQRRGRGRRRQREALGMKRRQGKRSLVFCLLVFCRCCAVAAGCGVVSDRCALVQGLQSSPFRKRCPDGAAAGSGWPAPWCGGESEHPRDPSSWRH